MTFKHASMTATPEGLVIRIPWTELAAGLRPRASKGDGRRAVEGVLRLVAQGRRAHAAGRTRLVRSLAELR